MEFNNQKRSTLIREVQGINENMDLVHQRKQFKMISDKLIEMVRNFDKVNDKLFVQFCPMADHNKGAFWLSLDEEIRNPYFGDAMLKCGEVKQTIE